MPQRWFWLPEPFLASDFTCLAKGIIYVHNYTGNLEMQVVDGGDLSPPVAVRHSHLNAPAHLTLLSTFLPAVPQHWRPAEASLPSGSGSSPASGASPAAPGAWQCCSKRVPSWAGRAARLPAGLQAQKSACLLCCTLLLKPVFAASLTWCLKRSYNAHLSVPEKKKLLMQPLNKCYPAL